MKQRKLYLSLLLISASTLLLNGCTKEEELNRTDDHRGGFTLTAVAESMSPERVITRASDPKNDAECEIRSLHVFLFGSDGNYLTRKTENNLYQGYQYIGSPTLHINGGAFANPTAAANATIYVVANVEAGTFGSITPEGYPEKIRNQADFEAFYYQPTHRTTVTVLPESGMPMFGFDTGIDLTQTNGSVIIEMKALMSRIDFTFKIDASSGTIGGLPSLILTECEVRNAATAVSFLPLEDDQESNLDINNDGQTDAVPPFHSILIPLPTSCITNKTKRISHSTSMKIDANRVIQAIRMLMNIPQAPIPIIINATNLYWLLMQTTIRYRPLMSYSRACLPMPMISTTKQPVQFF